jgi:hypothetical protein
MKMNGLLSKNRMLLTFHSQHVSAQIGHHKVRHEKHANDYAIRTKLHTTLVYV